MDKDIFIDDIFKEKAKHESIKVPDNIYSVVRSTIAELPDKKPITKRYLAAAVAIFLMGFVSFSAAFPALAQNIPVVSSVFDYLHEKNLVGKEYLDYTTDVNASQTSNGITVSINSIVYDGIELSIGYTVKSDQKLKSMPHILDKEFKINGRTTSFASGGSGYFIDENNYVGVDNFSVARDYLPKSISSIILGGNVKVPDRFDMDLNIKELLGDIKGNWNFKFKVTSEKVKGKVKNIKTAIDLSKVKASLKVNEIVLTPINTALRSSQLQSSNSDDMVQYIAVDDKGRRLSEKGITGNGSSKELYYEHLYSSVYKDTDYIVFTPYVSKENKTEIGYKTTTLNMNEATILPMGKFGEYKIERLEFRDDKTIMYFKCSKTIPDNALYQISLIDESGKESFLDLNHIKEVDPVNGAYEGEFPVLSRDSKYTVKVINLEERYELKEDSKFTVQTK